MYVSLPDDCWAQVHTGTELGTHLPLHGQVVMSVFISMQVIQTLSSALLFLRDTVALFPPLTDREGLGQMSPRPLPASAQEESRS